MKDAVVWCGVVIEEAQIVVAGYSVSKISLTEILF